MVTIDTNSIFTPVTGQWVAPMDLERASTAYNTLQQGHLTALQTESAINAELSKLDLNEAEDEWRNERINEIRSALNDNMRYGNAYSSLGSIIRKGSEIMSDTGMIGRLRAQKDYSDYIKQLDARNDIPDDYKTYYKTVNQYEYHDITNDKGEIIGGSKWKPKEQEVSTVSLSSMFNEALKLVAKESGGGSIGRWLDANGNVTEDWNQSVTGEIFSTTTGQWERVTKEKLAQALTAVIEGTPGAKASLEQDYKIAKWKYDQNGGVNPDITSTGGYLLTPEEYLQKRINPFYEAASYYNYKSSTTYGKAVTANLEYRAKKAGAGDNVAGNNFAGVTTFETNPVTIKNNAPIEEQANLTNANRIISDLLYKNSPNERMPDVMRMTDEELWNSISQISNPADKAELIRQMRVRSDANEYLNNLKEDMSESDRRAFEAYTAIMSGSELPQGTNRRYDEYVSQSNRLFYNAKFIRNYLNDDVAQKVINDLGGREAAAAMGITMGSVDGRSYVQLDRDYKQYLATYGQAVRDQINDQNMFREWWHGFKGGFNPYAGDSTVAISDDGKQTPIFSESDYATSQGDEVFADIVDYVNSLNSDYDKALNYRSTLVMPLQGIVAASPEEAEAIARFKADPSSENQHVYKYTQDEALRALQNIDLVQSGALVVNDVNQYERMDSKDRLKWQNRLRDQKNTTISDPQMIFDPNTQQWSPMFNVTYKTDNKGKYETVTIYVPGAYQSKINNSWNNNTSFIAKNDVNTHYLQKRDLTVSNGAAFDGFENIYLRFNENGSVSLVDKTDNANLGSISMSDATQLREDYLNWKHTYEYVRAGLYNLSNPAIEALAQKTATSIAHNIVGSNDANVIAEIRNRLITNLRK